MSEKDEDTLRMALQARGDPRYIIVSIKSVLYIACIDIPCRECFLYRDKECQATYIADNYRNILDMSDKDFSKYHPEYLI